MSSISTSRAQPKTKNKKINYHQPAMTKSAPEWTAMTKLVNQISARQDAEPFREAVDWRGIGLFDYPQVVKQPMDLGLIKKRIETGFYKSVHDAANDVRLVWKNCMTYNADGSDFFVLAENFAKRFEDKFAKLLKDHASAIEASKESANKSSEPSMADKHSFAKLLYRISKEELGKVINDLDEKCPAALTKNAAEDEVEINVDAISSGVFSDVNGYVRKCAGETGGRKKKASADSGGNTKKSRKSKS